MNSIARMPANARAELFAETADRKDLPDAIVEKDILGLLGSEAAFLN